MLRRYLGPVICIMQESERQDINEVFDNILLAEDNLVKAGYQEGFEKGALDGNSDGYHLGYHRGAEVGAELGYYYGVAIGLLNVKEVSEKVVIILHKLITLIDQFPKSNVDDIDITAELERIKRLYKKACSMAKISAEYPEVDCLSF